MTTPSETPLTDESRHWLAELLAVIHKDGGHNLGLMGAERAVTEALAVIYDERTALTESRAECERLQPEPCCQEWHTCNKRCSPLAENWRMAAKQAEVECERLRGDIERHIKIASEALTREREAQAEITRLTNRCAALYERGAATEKEAYERAAKVCDELEEYLWVHGSPEARTAVQDVSGRIRDLADERRNET